jgi:site-specific DNA recombinase
VLWTVVSGPYTSHRDSSVERAYGLLALPTEFIADLTSGLEATLADEQALAQQVHHNLKIELARLDAKEEQLLDLVGDASLPQDRLKQRLRDIHMDRTRIQTSMQNTTDELAAGATVLQDALGLLRDPYQLNLRSPEATRRELNQALNHHFYCNDDGQVTAALRAPFDDLHRAAVQQAQTKRQLLSPTPVFTTNPELATGPDWPEIPQDGLTSGPA